MAAAGGEDEDFALFRKAMEQQGVKEATYQEDKLAPRSPAPKATPRPRRRSGSIATGDENSVEDDGSVASTQVVIDETQNEGPVLFARRGVSKKMLSQLRRSRFALDESIDLHGMVETEARAALARFLEEAHQFHWQWIQIIHGKGLNSPQNGAVLRPMAIHWLKQQTGVLAFCSADARDGGTGATNVLLDVSV